MSVSVLIVGAGISGLSCGYHLNALAKDYPNVQLKLKIVDARDDVGGRIQNVTDAGFITAAGLDLDMGGQDLFFGDQDQYAGLLTDEDQDKFRTFRENFPTVPYANSGRCESARNNVGNDCEASKNGFPTSCTSNNYYNYCVCKGTPPSSDDGIDGIVCERDESTLTAIANTNGGDCEDWCNKYIGGYSFTKCGEYDDFSSCKNQDGLYPRDLRNTSFADASLATFVKEFFYKPIKKNVRLNTEIVKIKYRCNKIKAIKANEKKLRADHLVVAVPKTVLRDETKLKFWPVLDDDIKNKFAKSGVKIAVRIWVEFEKNFYNTVTDFPDADDGARYWDAVKGYTTNRNIVTTQGNRNEFLGTRFGDNALTDMTDTELRDLLIRDMDAAYNGAASQNFDYNADKSYVRNYAKEKYIEMSRSKKDVDFSNTNFGVQGTSLGLVDGRIWFIGDYLDGFPDNPSAESGKLAARKIWEKIIRDME